SGLSVSFLLSNWPPRRKLNCQLQLLPTTVRLAPANHLEERSLSIGDELAESPLVSKSRITQIRRPSPRDVLVHSRRALQGRPQDWRLNRVRSHSMIWYAQVRRQAVIHLRTGQTFPLKRSTMAFVRYLVSDVQKAVDFYSAPFDFTVQQQFGPAMAILKRGDLTLWLAGPHASASRPMPDGRKPEPGGWNR